VSRFRPGPAHIHPGRTAASRRRLLGVALATPLAAAATVVLATPASAHVTVQAPGATQGGYTKLTFRAPTERPVATTKIQVQFPAEHPIASVSVKPMTGWTYTVTKGAPPQPLEVHGRKVDEVVRTIEWTVAPGNPGIKAGEFEEFEVSAGPLPKADQLTFKALQTYANGEVVRWIADRQPGQPEPERPAPVLKVAAAATGTESASLSSPGTVPVAATDDEGNDVVAIAALAVSLLALALGAIALLRARRPLTR
jgi:uncharacterized protein